MARLFFQNALLVWPLGYGHLIYGLRVRCLHLADSIRTVQVSAAVLFN